MAISETSGAYVKSLVGREQRSHNLGQGLGAIFAVEELVDIGDRAICPGGLKIPIYHNYPTLMENADRLDMSHRGPYIQHCKHCIQEY